MNEQDKKKVQGFVDHLLQIPNIKGEPLLLGEGLILNFITQNMAQLKVTFKTPQFFPTIEWNDVLQVLLADLYDRVANEALPQFNTFIDTTDFTVLNKISEGAELPNNFHQEKLHAFIESIFRNKDVRYNFNTVSNLFRYNIIERYLGEIFKRRDFLYNELVRVQKTYLEMDEYIIFLKVLLLIRNAAYVKVAPGGGDTVKQNLFDTLSMKKKMQQFLQFRCREIRGGMPMFSERTIELALKSNLRTDLIEKEDASARFLFILTARFANYRPVARVDRGAESPDKSWFAIARKNAEHSGFDRRMLDAFYMIASDNNW